MTAPLTLLQVSMGRTEAGVDAGKNTVALGGRRQGFAASASLAEVNCMNADKRPSKLVGTETLSLGVKDPATDKRSVIVST